MIEKCDVLLTYEIRNREIENLCLIKHELEKRGYSVQIRMQYETFFRSQPPLEARVVVVPAYYRPRARFYTASHTIRTERILNMMWEQVLDSSSETEDKLHSIKPWGRIAAHIAWGNHMQQRLINEFGVDPRHVFKTGHIALDFLRYPLLRYFEDKKTLFTEYGIPLDKRANLFISSFALADADLHVLKKASMNDKDGSRYQKFGQQSAESRRELLQWFERILQENKDDVIIYRPHPEEKVSELLLELTERQDRFFVIGEKSVKQWILVCDKIYSWMSTSVAEVYAAGKGCSVLRPIEVSKENDIGIYQNTNYITSYEAFQMEFHSGIQTHTIEQDVISENYFIPQEKMTYELICDAIERVLSDDSFLISPSMKNPLLGAFSTERIKNRIKRTIANSKTLEKLHSCKKSRRGYLLELIDNIFYVKEKLEKNATSEEEINEITSRIHYALYSEDRGTSLTKDDKLNQL